MKESVKKEQKNVWWWPFLKKNMTLKNWKLCLNVVVQHFIDSAVLADNPAPRSTLSRWHAVALQDSIFNPLGTGSAKQEVEWMLRVGRQSGHLRLTQCCMGQCRGPHTSAHTVQGRGGATNKTNGKIKKVYKNCDISVKFLIYLRFNAEVIGAAWVIEDIGKICQQKRSFNVKMQCSPWAQANEPKQLTFLQHDTEGKTWKILILQDWSLGSLILWSVHWTQDWKENER